WWWFAASAAVVGAGAIISPAGATTRGSSSPRRARARAKDRRILASLHLLRLQAHLHRVNATLTSHVAVVAHGHPVTWCVTEATRRARNSRGGGHHPLMTPKRRGLKAHDGPPLDWRPRKDGLGAETTMW